MKKGFTLIELLAVIVILAIIALIATPIVLNIINDTKKSAILRSADFYVQGIEYSISTKKLNSGEITNGTYDVMQDGNLCIGTYESSECIGEVLKVLVNGEIPDYGKITIIDGEIKNISLRYQSNNVIKNNNGEVIYSPCRLIDDIGQAGISSGDKYQCKVKDKMENGFEDGYFFFILGTNEDGTANLIMERNIHYDEDNNVGKVATEINNGSVPWVSESDYGCGITGDKCSQYGKGPLTVMTYLYNATKDWVNVPNIEINYDDERINGYGENGGNPYKIISTTDNPIKILDLKGAETLELKNLKSRIPLYNEVHGQGKCLRYEENGYGSCPLWLANYLEKTSYVTGEGLQNIAGIYGYWTLSSYGSASAYAWAIINKGLLDVSYVYRSNIGVRPVITVKL